MRDVTRIERAFFQPTAELAVGRGSALIEGFLSDTVGHCVCLVLIERPDRRFTLIVDNEWVELGIHIQNLDPKSVIADDFDIPRHAMRAVIAGWPGDWDADRSPTLSTHYSADGIPHLSVIDSEVATITSPAASSHSRAHLPNHM